jgi:hypothetical protein
VNRSPRGYRAWEVDYEEYLAAVCRDDVPAGEGATLLDMAGLAHSRVSEWLRRCHQLHRVLTQQQERE